jgi:hypothetical protein
VPSSNASLAAVFFSGPIETFYILCVSQRPHPLGHGRHPERQSVTQSSSWSNLLLGL